VSLAFCISRERIPRPNWRIDYTRARYDARIGVERLFMFAVHELWTRVKVERVLGLIC